MKLRFNIKDVVSLIHDPEKLPRVVTKYEVSETQIVYCLTQGTSVSWHYSYEIKSYTAKKIGFKK